MKKLRTSSFALTAVLALLSAAAMAFPQVASVQGKAWITANDGKRVPVKAKMALRGKVLLETNAASNIRITWDSSREFSVLESSNVLIPSIGWDSGEASLILLKSGSIRWKASGSKSYNVALSSDLFEFIAPPGDFVLSYAPQSPYAEVKMLKGSMEFTYLNGEELVRVKEGQQVGFRGVLEDGKVVYDVLLQGRKIPRGKLTGVTQLDQAFLKGYDAAAEKKKRFEAEQAKKALEAKNTLGQICRDPGAGFNQCAWVCVGNPKKEKKICQLQSPGVQCIRQRCNANGQWADKMVMDGEKAQNLCKAQPRVAVCDY